MSSCTNSSNIRSTLLSQVIRETSDGKRVVFVVNSNDVGVTSGVTLGSVIRFDVNTDRYELSKADDPTTAEVVGVVESIVGTNYTVVANGLMIYPNIGNVINSYTGGCTPLDSNKDGGGGGADIFFLSDGCAGKLQYVEPTTPGRIVKPVMQRVKVGPSGPSQYNAIVLNYIGYEVAENATSSLTDQFPLAETSYFEEPPKSGWLEISENRKLNVSEYSDLYSALGTKYGQYEEELILVDTGVLPNLSSLANASVFQNNPNGTRYSTGIVISGDSSTKKIRIKKDPSQPIMNQNFRLRVGNFSFQLSSTSVTAFTTPKQDPIKKEFIYQNNTKEEVTLKPYMRTNAEITKVSIPTELSIEKINSDNIITNNVNVGAKLTNFEIRVANIERRLGIQ